jgi:hypothetical protein
VQLFPHVEKSIGGAACDLPIPGVPDSVELGYIGRGRTKGEFLLRACAGFTLKINGQEAGEGATYRLGQKLEFVDKLTGTAFLATLSAGHAANVSFGDALATGPAFGAEAWYDGDDVGGNSSLPI